MRLRICFGSYVKYGSSGSCAHGMTTRAATAKEHGLPKNKLRDVAVIKKEMPEVFNQIASGETTVRVWRVGKIDEKARRLRLPVFFV